MGAVGGYLGGNFVGKMLPIPYGDVAAAGAGGYFFGRKNIMGAATGAAGYYLGNMLIGNVLGGNGGLGQMTGTRAGATGAVVYGA